MKRKVEKEWKIVLPTSVELGYQSIKIIEGDLIEGQGVYRCESSEIRIKESLNDRETLNTILHEILHAAVYVYGLKNEFKDDDHEEKVVNALGNALTEMCIRNPKLVSWIEQNVRSL